MSAARVNSDGRAIKLDRPAQSDEQVTAEDVADASKLARLLTRVLRDLADVRRRFWPNRIDFEDVAVSSGGATKRLTHNFGGRVRYWVVEWSATTAPILKTHSDTDTNTLVLASYVAGTATIRVEEGG